MSLATRLQELAVRIGTEFKTLRSTLGTNATLVTTEKGTLVGAINEVRTLAQSAASSGGAQIDDATTSATKVWSSQKTSATVDERLQARIGAAPAALDTLEELAAALNNDASFAASTTTALGNRVRVDAAQAFSAPQQTQGRANLAGPARRTSRR